MTERILVTEAAGTTVSKGMLDSGMPTDLVDGLVGLLEWFAMGGGAEVCSTVENLTGSPGRSFETFFADYAGELRVAD